MTNPVEHTKKTIDNILSFIEQSPWRSYYLETLKHLKVQAGEPCVLAVAGRVKAGKSSFINAILGDNLAMVGTTECTATINYFRKGTPPDPKKPILVVWENGQKQYETIEFLNALQGNDKETLKKALGINRLEYHLNNPLFDEITLVDTPGTDAIVEEHQDRVMGFFGSQNEADQKKLREKHSEQTMTCTNDADAVIYVLGSVANVSAQEFLRQFQDTSHGANAMKSVGVIAKIDISDDHIHQRFELAANIMSKMNRELNTVVPVSSGIWQALEDLKKENKLAWMHSKLREIHPEGFDYLMKQESTYFSTSNVFDKIFARSKMPPISKDDREKLKGNMPWRVFVVIAQHLYKYPIEEAVEKLTEISGINQVMTILQNRFFKRGRILRCYRISCNLREILSDIERNRLYELKKEVCSRKEFEEFIDSHPRSKMDKEISDRFKTFLKTYLKTEEELNKLESLIKNELLPEVENLQLKLQHTDDNFTALQLIDQNRALFSKEECDELFSLFGMYGDSPVELSMETRSQRQQFWNLELNLCRNIDRRKVAQHAASAYGNLESE